MVSVQPGEPEAAGHGVTGDVPRDSTWRETLELKLAAKEAQLVERGARIAVLEAELSEVVSEAEDLKEKVEAYRASSERVEAQCSKVMKENGELRVLNDRIGTENERLRHGVEILQRGESSRLRPAGLCILNMVEESSGKALLLHLVIDGLIMLFYVLPIIWQWMW